MSDAATLLTHADIAKQTGCSLTTIWRAANRLGIQPEQKSGGGYKFYTPEQAATIIDARPRVKARKQKLAQ